MESRPLGDRVVGADHQSAGFGPHRGGPEEERDVDGAARGDLCPGGKTFRPGHPEQILLNFFLTNIYLF